MRALHEVRPSQEQLTLFARMREGVVVIRGAAGSGKTTTALLKLRSVLASFHNRKLREGRTEPLRVLVLTFNRTLSGYIKQLATSQLPPSDDIELEISTFSKWAVATLGQQKIIEPEYKRELMARFTKQTPYTTQFVEEEADYILGRFMPQNLADYVARRRDGRGGTPRMDQTAKQLFIQNVITPYIETKQSEGLKDWNDIALELVSNKFYAYDIIVADETQDFSANQLRAVMNQLADVHSVTFVLDTIQRIYASGFTWQELNIEVRPENSFRLTNNYRNTKEIAQFAASAIDGIGVDDDGATPNFERAESSGSRPIMLAGRYPQQVQYAIDFIVKNVQGREETVAFLHPLGWFKTLKEILIRANLPFADITRQPEWPDGPENIALSTLHSAKGLEFDHVFILGLDADTTEHGDGDDDERLTTLRRLLAMGIGRARKSVTIGYLPSNPSKLLDFLDPSTYDAKNV